MRKSTWFVRFSVDTTKRLMYNVFQMTKEAIASRLRQARIAAGLSQHDVGAALNPPQRRHEISRYERNKATPGVLTIAQLAKVLQVEPCWLAWGIEHGK